MSLGRGDEPSTNLSVQPEKYNVEKDVEAPMFERGQIMSEEERIDILNFACSIYHTCERIKHDRLVYRLKEGDTIVPPIIWTIKQRIIEKEGLHVYAQEPFLKDFLSFILPGGFIHPHTDPNEKDLFHARMNVIILNPKLGCETYYDTQRVNVQEGEYAFCRSGMDMHYVKPNKDTYPRISLSFGFLVPAKKLNEIYIKGIQ